jgi:hypothetical protein
MSRFRRPSRYKPGELFEVRRPSRAPGQFAHVGWLPLSERGLAVAVLGYSEALFAEWITADPSPVTFCRLQLNAARYWGGRPRAWLFEEPDAAILTSDGRGGERYAFPLERLAERLECQLGVWRDPSAQGLVTPAIDYVMACAFMRCRQPTLAAANRVLDAFLDHEAKHRPHPRQTGRTVEQMFATERPRMRPLPDDIDALEAEIVEFAEAEREVAPKEMDDA